jgi:hypothetical protein
MVAPLEKTNASNCRCHTQSENLLTRVNRFVPQHQEENLQEGEEDSRYLISIKQIKMEILTGILKAFIIQDLSMVCFSI